MPGVQDVTTADARRDAQVRRLREEYPVFRVEDARAAVSASGVTVEFAFAAGALRFRPVLEITGLRRDEAGRAGTVTARRMIRALAIIEAFSYWKALCSPVIEVALPAPDPAELDGWRGFGPGAMGEFFYRNGIDYTAPGFLGIRGPAGGDTTVTDLAVADAPLVLVVGSEGRGLSRLVAERCDVLARIPMAADTESLNAGVAAGIALHAVAAARIG